MNQATFNIHPLNRFGGSNTTIRRPRVCPLYKEFEMITDHTKEF